MVTANVSYLFNAAHHSRNNTRHWLRYLRKVISENGTILSENEIKELVRSNELSMMQVVTLNAALNPTTETHRQVIGLNKPAQMPFYAELMKRVHNGASE